MTNETITIHKIFPQFRHLETEPSPNEENWTVEEVLQYKVYQSSRSIQNKLNEQIRQLNALKDEVIQQNAAAAVESASQVAPSTVTLHILVQSGPHEGMERKLELEAANSNNKKQSACLVGRSKAHKYKVSLFQDLEVSTSHGKFVLKENSEPCFVDTDSTNGTLVLLPQGGSERLAPHEPYPLTDGTVLLLGQSKLLIQVLE